MQPTAGGDAATTPFEPAQNVSPVVETQPTATAAPATAQPTQTNRFSYDSNLEARDSALIQLDGPLLDVEALTPKKPAPDLSNIMDLDLGDDFFSKTPGTAATGVDPWGGGGGQASYGAATGGGNMQQQSSPWGMQAGGGGGRQQQFTTGYGQPTGYGQQASYGQPTGYGQPTSFGQPTSYGQPTGYGQQAGYGQSAAYGRPAQGQNNAWGMAGQGARSGGTVGQPAQAAQQQAQAPQKALSQEEFDQLWDELCTPMTNF